MLTSSRGRRERLPLLDVIALLCAKKWMSVREFDSHSRGHHISRLWLCADGFSCF